VRAEERARLADVIEHDRDTLVGYAGDKAALVGLLAVMLRLGSDTAPEEAAVIVPASTSVSDD
jgi:hypothetical protein